MQNKKSKDKSNNKALFWVGIGASAGGLEALKNLTMNLSKNNNMTYIIVQHLSPHHKSMLVELINRETPLDVREVEDGTKPQEGVIYITPSKHEIYVKADRLFLKDSLAEIGPKPSVNNFFNSLAEEKKEYAIGIILSGTGSDGAHGIRSIRAAGGVTIAQNDSTAKYFSMPEAAIKTGCIDLILSPEEIAKRLPSIINTPRNILQLERNEDKGHTLHQIFGHLKKHSGIDFSEYKAATINRRIERRMAAEGIHTIEDYLSLINDNKKEISLLFKDMLISVTSFFRDKNSFSAIKKFCQEIVASPKKETIRIWVPGCATGEEVYSLAMVFVEIMGIERFTKSKLIIFATDVDEHALSIARRGTYRVEISNELSREYLKKYFDTLSDHYTIKKFIKSKIVFSKHDVISEPPFSKIDMISCRNLLIYFNTSLQRKIFQIFHYSLLPEGILFLGKSESIGDSDEYYSTLDSSNRIFMKKMSRETNPNSYSAILRARIPEIKRTTSAKPDVTSVSDKLVSVLAPHSVLFDEKLNIRHIYGDVKEFIDITPGVASMNIMSIINKKYSQEIHSLTYKSINHNIVASAPFKKVTIGGIEQKLQVIVYPVFTDIEYEKLFLVTFNLQKFANKTAQENLKEEDYSRMEELENELSSTKEYLQTVVEELETSNEELQSLNEELQSANEGLQSANEELETSNEELQSTNEELSTVNDEIQVRSLELEDSNNHLSNVKESVDIPIILLDKGLNLTLFNSKSVEIFVEKPQLLHNITFQPLIFDIPNLRKKLLDVVKSRKACTEELYDNGKYYVIRMTPYLSSDNILEGVVLVFIDNTEIKLKEAELRASTDLYESVLEATRDGIWHWFDIEKDEEYWSPQWKKLLGYEANEIAASASSFFKMLHPDDRSLTEKALKSSLAGDAPFDVEYRLQTKSGKYKWFRAKGIAKKNQTSGQISMIGSISDIDRYRTIAKALDDKDLTLRSFIESSYDGYWDWLIQEDYEYMSPQFWQMFGYDPKKMKHHPSEWQKIISEDGLKIALENFDKHVKTKGKHPFHQEVEYIHKDGSPVYVMCKGKVVEWGPKGEPIRMIGTHTNITKTKKIENELKAYSNSLEYANQELNDFTQIASHDLKEPLRGLTHNANMLLTKFESNPDKDCQKRAERIIFLAKKMEKLISDLLHIAKLQKSDPKTSKINLLNVLNDIQEEMKELYKTENVKITMPNKLPSIEYNVTHIAEIFKNLLINAIKYNTNKVKNIEIGYNENIKDMYTFYVKDNGIGIDKKHYKQIFKMFRRLNNESEDIKGTGVGLTFVQKIIQKHNGEIWVESNPEVGSVFYFTVPKASKKL